MELNKDFEELLHHLNSVHARYLVAGAYAVIFYTEPRYTKDLDIWIEPTRENAEKVYEALRRFGAPIEGVTIADLMNPHMVYQVGVEPNRVDILMGIGRIKFEEAWKKRKADYYGKEKIHFLHLDHLIRTKKEAGRPHDQTDLDILLKVKKKKKR